LTSTSTKPITPVNPHPPAKTGWNYFTAFGEQHLHSVEREHR
jgi:hypothetical protein